MVFVQKEIAKAIVAFGNRAHSALEKQSAQGMVEYALILVLVSIVVIVILLTMGHQIANVFSNVVAALGIGGCNPGPGGGQC
jgi:pilus assembly protein Flp/PilA